MRFLNQQSLMFSSLSFFFLVNIITLINGEEEACRTANNTAGICVPYTECDFLKQLYERHHSLPREYMNYVYKSRCKPEADVIHICCESPDSDKNELNRNGLSILQNTKCGLSSNDRIAFGTEVDIGEFPWMAALRYNSENLPFQCGGSLITDRYVLTAAHCVVGIVDELIGVRLGEHNIKDKIDCQTRGTIDVCNPPAEDYGIAKRIPHKDYSFDYKINDIALLKLDRVVNFKTHIKPICLPITPKSTRVAQNQDYFISGWGLTQNVQQSQTLLKAIVTHKDLSYCQKIFRLTRLSNNHLCAGGDSKIDTCQGDSGGPLFFVNTYQRAGRYIQYGIISFGVTSCGVKGLPGIYTNIITQLPWITNNLD